MKKVNYIIYVLTAIFLFMPFIINAESITNNNGIVISEEDYNNFRKVYDHDYIMNINIKKFQKLKTLNFEDITSQTKYFELVYNRDLNLTTEREITKEEYERINPHRLPCREAVYENQVKKLNMSIIGAPTWNYVVVSSTWKGIPSTRSFDVNGIRGFDFDFRNGSQEGEQKYTLNGQLKTISYSWNGTNIKRFSNGFGISMNIVNSDITFLQYMVECDVKALDTHPSIFASSQHAHRKLSLADSQNYTLGGAGLGGVFVFPYNISIKYDGMTGVVINY